ncbi:fumarate reductase/succinate dehydrogenase flavoprotein domain-containing protein [Klebsiella pneumoniae]|nr:fumarate reductase/succinate dehydrogenase flavoprotein domain-containing protein [Klebsiella pneumoniae]
MNHPTLWGQSTLGPGLTFGYLAACHLAQHSTH